MTNRPIRNLARTAILAAAICGTLAVASWPARAATTQGIPSIVEVTNGGSAVKQLLVQVAGQNFFAQQVAPSGCSSADADMQKVWLSMAQAALLAGKNVNVITTFCAGNGFNMITGIDIIR